MDGELAVRFPGLGNATESGKKLFFERLFGNNLTIEGGNKNSLLAP
jgi:hypothetical protein